MIAFIRLPGAEFAAIPGIGPHGHLDAHRKKHYIRTDFDA